MSLIVVSSPAGVRSGQLSERKQHAVTQHFKVQHAALLTEQYGAAEQELRAAVRKAAIGVGPSFGEAHSNLAVVYLVTGRITESDAAVRAAEQAGFKVNPRLKDDITAAKKKSGPD